MRKLTPAVELLEIPEERRIQVAELLESGALAEFNNILLSSVIDHLPAGYKLTPQLAQLLRGNEVEL